MAGIEEVKKLAALARIRIDEDALPTFAKEFDAILAYVGQLEKLSIPKESLMEQSVPRNVFRDDGEPTPSGTYTEKLVEQFPEREGNYLVVKQIIAHD